jgi:hypothetical protein
MGISLGHLGGGDISKEKGKNVIKWRKKQRENRRNKEKREAFEVNIGTNRGFLCTKIQTLHLDYCWLIFENI